MFDLGMGELIIIVIVAILVIGPEQMPKILYKLGKWMRQFSYTRFAIERQFDQFMAKEEIKEHEAETAQATLEKPKEGTDGQS